MARTGTSATLALDIEGRLRDEILQGLLVPGQRLMAADQAPRLGVSQSVVREALTRLVQRRLVVLEDNHGFRVADVSPNDLLALTYARKLNESAALRLSIEQGDVDWEAEAVAAHHRLSVTPMDSDGDTQRTDKWMVAHRDFHNKLYQGHDNAILYQICESLADRAELYRRWSVVDPASPRRDLQSEHTGLMRAVLARDAGSAVSLLNEHIDRTSQIVRSNWEFHRLANAHESES